MTKEKKLIIAEQVCEFAIGWTVGAVVMGVAQPEGTVNKLLTAIGGSAIALVVGRQFGKEFVEVCDAVLDTNLKDKVV